MTTKLGAGVCAVLLATTGLAHAATPADYAHRWPLREGRGGPAFHVELSPDVLAALQDPAQGDFEVFDATGASMPVAPAGLGPGRDWLPALFLGGAPADGPAGDAGVMSYRFQLPAVHGVDAVRVLLGASSARQQVAVQYRSGDAWATAARLLATPAGDAAATDTRLEAVATAREWRLQSGRALAPAPALQLATRPPRYLVLARGAPPYVLAAGHTALRRPATLDAELARLRDRQGAGWQPAVATLGTLDSVPATASPPPAPERGWWRWAAWASVGVALVLVLGLALRRRRFA